MSTPVNAVVLNVNDALQKAIQDSLNPEEIKASVRAEIEKQQTAAAVTATTVGADKIAADKVIADKAAADAAATAAATQKFTRTEVIGGKEFTFDGESESEVNSMVLNAYRVAQAVTEPAAVVVDPTVAAAAAEKAAADAVVAKSELELKFKRGEVTASEYIEQSGAMKEYLEKNGVPLDELKAAVDKNRTQTYEVSWQDATKTFLTSDAGKSWPGGDKNLKLIGLKLASMDLTDAPDKVAALAAAYESLKADGILFDNPAVAAPAAAAPAAGAAPVVPAAAAPVASALPVVPQQTAPQSSSLFGVSSGVAGTTVGAEKPAPAKVELDPNATPQEIMAAWKQSQIAAGKDLNASFTDAFSGKRA
jgi:hypothetical protein